MTGIQRPSHRRGAGMAESLRRVHHLVFHRVGSNPAFSESFVPECVCPKIAHHKVRDDNACTRALRLTKIDP